MRDGPSSTPRHLGLVNGAQQDAMLTPGVSMTCISPTYGACIPRHKRRIRGRTLKQSTGTTHSRLHVVRMYGSIVHGGCIVNIPSHRLVAKKARLLWYRDEEHLRRIGWKRRNGHLLSRRLRQIGEPNVRRIRLGTGRPLGRGCFLWLVSDAASPVNVSQ